VAAELGERLKRFKQEDWLPQLLDAARDAYHAGDEHDLRDTIDACNAKYRTLLRADLAERADTRAPTTDVLVDDLKVGATLSYYSGQHDRYDGAERAVVAEITPHILWVTDAVFVARHQKQIPIQVIGSDGPSFFITRILKTALMTADQVAEQRCTIARAALDLLPKGQSISMLTTMAMKVVPTGELLARIARHAPPQACSSLPEAEIDAINAREAYVPLCFALSACEVCHTLMLLLQIAG
jgi:hypothetical protein